MKATTVNIKDLARYDTMSPRVSIMLQEEEARIGRQLSAQEIEQFKAASEQGV